MDDYLDCLYRYILDHLLLDARLDLIDYSRWNNRRDFAWEALEKALTPEQLHSPQTQHQARIFDRVLEVCVPVFCGTDSMRERAGRENMERMKGILGAG